MKDVHPFVVDIKGVTSVEEIRDMNIGTWAKLIFYTIKTNVINSSVIQKKFRLL